jgi:hypothetical protein
MTLIFNYMSAGTANTQPPEQPGEVVASLADIVQVATPQ